MGMEERVNVKGSEALPLKKTRTAEVKKESIPKTFMKHIRTLGFQETDAHVLYEDKYDWMGISTGRLFYTNYVYNFVPSTADSSKLKRRQPCERK